MHAQSNIIEIVEEKILLLVEWKSIYELLNIMAYPV